MNNISAKSRYYIPAALISTMAVELTGTPITKHFSCVCNGFFFVCSYLLQRRSMKNQTTLSLSLVKHRNHHNLSNTDFGNRSSAKHQVVDNKFDTMNAFYLILPSAGDWILAFLTLENRSNTDWLVNDKTSHKLPSLIVLNESVVMQVCSTYFLFLRSGPPSHQP